MSQTNDPNKPATAEDYNAQKALDAAQADALDARTRLIASQKALAKAQAAEDPAAAQLAVATQAANIAAQQKALSDSQAAILKNNFIVPESGFTGTVTANDKAGTFEATLLAARAANTAATGISDQIKTAGHASGSIVLYGTSDLPDFQPLIAFQAQYNTLNQTLLSAIAEIDARMGGLAKFDIHNEAAFTPAVIGAAFDAANKLLGYFRTDYTIQGVSVTADDALLVNALADALRRKSVTVTMPALFNAPALMNDSPIVQSLVTLADLRSKLQQKVDVANAHAEGLGKLASAEADAAKKTEETNGAADLKALADQGKAALALYDGLITKLTTPDDKAKVPLAAIIPQDAVRTALRAGANLLVAKVSSAGGSWYTKKNFWTFFGGMPFYTMGGVVVHYNLLDGRTGAVLAAGAIPIDGGFFKIGKLPEALSKPPQQ